MVKRPDPSGSRLNLLSHAIEKAAALSAIGAFAISGCSTSTDALPQSETVPQSSRSETLSEAVSAQSGTEKSSTSTGSGSTSATKTESTPPKSSFVEQSSANTAESSTDTAESERVPLRDWKGLEMLDSLSEDPDERTRQVREFIMLNDPECNLTQDYISINTVQGGFTRVGDELMEALNVVGSLYSDPTVKGNQKKADMLIDGMTSYHSPEANKKLKIFIHDTFFEAEFMDQCRPEVCNQRFSGAAITQETDTLVVVPTDIGDPQQGYTISAKLQLAHKDLGVGEKGEEPVLHISLNVGGVITKFEVE